MTFVFGGLVTFIPLDAQNRDIGNAASFFIIFAVGLTFLRPFFGYLADRLPNRGAILVSGLLLVAASPMSLFLTVEPWTLPLAAILWALGFGSVQPIIRVMVLERAPQSRWGSAAATTSTAWDIGFTLGAAMLGVIAEKIGIPAMFAFSSLAGFMAIIVVVGFRLHRDMSIPLQSIS
jgi:predicted MFS family arabinose efflux permease